MIGQVGPAKFYITLHSVRLYVRLSVTLFHRKTPSKGTSQVDPSILSLNIKKFCVDIP
jgi:hypothetical protein